MRLDGKVALIVGGGGIGGAIARAYGAAGAAGVVVADLDAARAEAVAAAIEAAGGSAFGAGLDAADEAAVAALVERAVGRYGEMHLLVNGAATVTRTTTILELSRAEWDAALTANLTSYFLACKYAIPAIARSGGGAIVNIASQLGHVGMAGRAAYCATKAAIINFTRALALDHAKDGIRVNSLSPGSVATERGIKQYGSIARMQAVRAPLHPIGRIGTPEEIAGAALFLASDASAFMTGADLCVDGGYIAQ